MITDQLIRINGIDVSRLIGYKVSFCKLWSKDSGRSMTGENKGTLIGIFPKLELKIGESEGRELAALLSVFNKPSAMVEYYDPEYRKVVSDSFYFGDVATELKRMRQDRYKGITVSVIANRRRK